MIFAILFLLSVVTGRLCHKVCSSDRCRGTRTNPIGEGLQWVTSRSRYTKGCCFAGWGTCDLCCQPDHQPRKVCHDTCSSDRCRGTRTNPVTLGTTWRRERSSYKGGCCGWWSGKCDLCCTGGYGREVIEDTEARAVIEDTEDTVVIMNEYNWMTYVGVFGIIGTVIGGFAYMKMKNKKNYEELEEMLGETY